MATQLTRNLRLRIDSDLSADSVYNLQRIDLLGASIQTDTTDTLQLRSRSDIVLEPEAQSIGGSGIGGDVLVGTPSHEIDLFAVYASNVNFSDSVGLLDSAVSGSKYLRLQYDSTLSGSVDTTADRTLSVDLDGADRELVLGANLSLTSFNLTLAPASALTLSIPASGTAVLLDLTQVLTNKSIDAATNTLTNISNAAISSTAAIAYSKLALSDSLLTTDLSPSFVLPVSAGGTGETTASDSLNALLPDQTGNANKVLQTDGTNTSWAAIGTGSVTSVTFTAPSQFGVTGSPITTAGTIALSLNTQTANLVWAGPATGADAVPTFRALVGADIGGLTTTDLAEGSNLYFTTARVQTVVGSYVYATTWTPGDGTSKSVTHSLATTDVTVTIYDIDSGETIYVDTETRTNANTVAFTATQAPTGSGWRVVIRK